MRRTSFLKRLGVLLACVLAGLATTAAAGPPARPSTPAQVTLDPRLPVHPYLQYGAQVDPNRKVRVILQKKNRTVSAQALARAVGGRVVREFAFVNGVVLEVPQRAVLNLARQPGVRYISFDGRVRHRAVDAASLQTSYPGTSEAVQVWNDPLVPATGRGVTVAVLDSGVNDQHPDLGANLLCMQVGAAADCRDGSGHGTHIVGIIKGRDAQGRYIGVAPDARVVSIRVADASGMAYESDVLAGLQWAFVNRTAQNIRVVSLSFSASIAESYATSPVAAAVEQLWLNGVTVVAAAGNLGSAADATWYAPGNDPYVVTVGALDDNQTTLPADDSLASFSSRGLTQDGFYKPEVVAPGRRIVSTLAGPTVTLAQQHPEAVVGTGYLRLSGTSMAAPVVAGAVALLLERYPGLTPDQVKWVLARSAASYPGQADGAGSLRLVAALQAAGGSPGVANQGLVPSSRVDPVSGTVLGGQGYWEQGYWEQGYWEQTANEMLPDQWYWD